MQQMRLSPAAQPQAPQFLHCGFYTWGWPGALLVLGLGPRSLCPKAPVFRVVVLPQAPASTSLAVMPFLGSSSCIYASILSRGFISIS